MIIAVSTVGDNLEAMVDPRFGRARNFLLYDTETREVRILPNEQNLQAVQGAGIQAGQNIVGHGAQVLITGNVGPKAIAVLRQAGLRVYTGASTTVRQAIDDYQAERLVETQAATKPGHWM